MTEIRCYLKTAGRVGSPELKKLTDGRVQVIWRAGDGTLLASEVFTGTVEAKAFADRLAAFTTTATPSTGATTSTSTSTTTATKVRWGAWISNRVPWDTAEYDAFITKIGRPQLLQFSSNFSYRFDTNAFNICKARGATPLFSWAPTGIPIAQVAAGSHDAYIREWATAAKAFGSEIVLKFAWEMNGTWFSWTGPDPATFKAMWTRAHGIFQTVGATNVKWHFCPNVDPDRRFRAMEDYYPGHQYVDYTGADGYNQGDGRSFVNLFGSTYARLQAVSGGMPFIVGETAATESGPVLKADWIKAMFAALPSYPRIVGVCWFHKIEADGSGHSDWNIDSSSASLAAFKAGIGGLA